MILKLSPCDIDVNISACTMGEFGLSDKFGTKHRGDCAEDLIASLVKLGADVSELTYTPPYWSFDKVDDVIEEVESPVETEIQVDQVVEDVSLEKEDTPLVDWEWIKTLKNNRQGKIDLDEYAKIYNVKLNQRSTLKNMIANFKTGLEG